MGSSAAAEFMVTQELLPSTSYLPDVEAIRANGVRVVMAAGRDSVRRRRFYAVTAAVLAERLGCAMVEMPGHHASYYDRPEEWAAALREVLHAVEGVEFS